jgi:hypothetical protein
MRDFVGKQERKRLLGRPRHRRENNVEMYFRETGWADAVWAQDGDKCRVVLNTAMNSLVQ